jgi:hypothetical protein
LQLNPAYQRIREKAKEMTFALTNGCTQSEQEVSVRFVEKALGECPDRPENFDNHIPIHDLPTQQTNERQKKERTDEGAVPLG